MEKKSRHRDNCSHAIGETRLWSITGFPTAEHEPHGNLIGTDDVLPSAVRPGHFWMLQLFVAPTPFENWGEREYDGTSRRQLLAVLIVSVGALALTLCVALLFSGEPLEFPYPSRFPIPACLMIAASLATGGRALRG